MLCEGSRRGRRRGGEKEGRGNEEEGEVRMGRKKEGNEKIMWSKQNTEEDWKITKSVDINHKVLEGKMYPLNLKGLEEGMAYLSK